MSRDRGFTNHLDLLFTDEQQFLRESVRARSTAKRAARAASSVVDTALCLHGAVGYTWEHDLQLLLKRAKSDAQLLGGAGAYDDRIADALALVPDTRLTAVGRA
jgi:alkylation response protein AidB-like acyl-CoA dehydrogenase